MKKNSRIILISGVSKGIGNALAFRFLSENSIVFGISRKRINTVFAEDIMACIGDCSKWIKDFDKLPEDWIVQEKKEDKNRIICDYIS